MLSDINGTLLALFIVQKKGQEVNLITSLLKPRAIGNNLCLIVMWSGETSREKDIPRSLMTLWNSTGQMECIEIVVFRAHVDDPIGHRRRGADNTSRGHSPEG